MKNQYFGDINDYRKYGLLRILADDGDNKIAICWMLTTNDNRTDGKFIQYLDQTTKWQEYDPELFDLLHQIIIEKKERNIELAETEKIIPSAIYFSDILTDDLLKRKYYFKRLLSKMEVEGCQSVFFDPDNGMEIKSKPKGRKDSAKYLYWDELSRFYSEGYSVLVYQHFPRIKRNNFVTSQAKQIILYTQTPKVFTFQTTKVVFFLVPQNDFYNRLSILSNMVAERWKSQIFVEKICEIPLPGLNISHEDILVKD